MKDKTDRVRTRATVSEREARLDRVAQVMLEHGCWTGRIETALAREWGVTRRQVRNYVADAKALIRDELAGLDESREDRRRRFVERLRAAQVEMRADRNWPAWVKAMSLEAQLTLDDKAGQHDGEAYRPLTDAEKARIAELATRH